MYLAQPEISDSNRILYPTVKGLHVCWEHAAASVCVQSCWKVGDAFIFKEKEAITMTVVLCCLLSAFSASLLDWLTGFMLPWLFC